MKGHDDTWYTIKPKWASEQNTIWPYQTDDERPDAKCRDAHTRYQQNEDELRRPYYTFLTNRRRASRRISPRRQHQKHNLANTKIEFSTWRRQSDARHRDACRLDGDTRFRMKRQWTSALCTTRRCQTDDQRRDADTKSRIYRRPGSGRHATRRLASRHRQNISNNAKMSLRTPNDTILANRRRASRSLSPRRRHDKSNLAKTSIGMTFGLTPKSRHPHKIPKSDISIVMPRHYTGNQTLSVPTPTKDFESSEEELRNAIRHGNGRPTRNVVTCIIPTMTRDGKCSNYEPRDAIRHDIGKPTPCFATYISATSTQEVKSSEDEPSNT
jgi:hypothetical protein